MIEFDNPVGNPKYYLQEHNRLEGGFQGKAAKMLGIEGEFSEEAYYRLCAGQNPHTGEKLSLRQSGKPAPAWEMTFNLSKDPSIVAEIGRDFRVVDLQYEMVKQSMKLVEKQTRVSVRKKEYLIETEDGPKYPIRYSGNIAWTAFGHDSSRANDPHTHVHAVVYPKTFDPVEKIWKRTELHHLDRTGIQKFYTDGMVKGLRQLGYKVKQDGLDIRITGVPAELKAPFSRRHEGIKKKDQEFEQKKGKPLTDKAKAKLSLYDRPDKVLLTQAEKYASWVSRLTDKQFTAIKSLVSKAKLAVQQYRWAEGLRKGFTKFYRSANEGHTVEKESVLRYDNARGQGETGIERGG